MSQQRSDQSPGLPKGSNSWPSNSSRQLPRSKTSFFRNPEVAYIHAHAAKRGCYLAQIERA
ncbi:MAG: DUF1203 domain-containing protein [Sphingomonas sp.]|nr:DUF1203 domain-containing protein [Sphingomonas sp.]